MRRLPPAALLAVLFFLLAPHASHAQLPPVRERIGGRLGFIATEGRFNESYTNGWNATLQFTEAIRPPFYLDIKLGAVYVGELQLPERANLFTQFFQGTEFASDMRILFISVGPQYVRSLGRDWLMGYGSVGIGIYSVSVLFDSGVQAFDISQSHVGGNASIGALLRFTNTWNLDLSITAHHMRTGNDASDYFYVLTKGGTDPRFAQFAAGITIDLR